MYKEPPNKRFFVVKQHAKPTEKSYKITSEQALTAHMKYCVQKYVKRSL